MVLDPPSDSTTTDVTGKQHARGVCFYIKRSWCSTVHVREELCTPNIELLAVSVSTSLENSRELFFVLVYIHPRANPTTATDHIKSTLNKLEEDLSPRPIHSSTHSNLRTRQAEVSRRQSLHL